MIDNPILYYVHDPMCSWCWGFKSVWQELRSQLENRLQIVNLLGGLATDTDEAMPIDMQMNIQDTWRSIEHHIPGVEFNFDFWEQCQPRRATYPACRAVIAARLQRSEAETELIELIQRSYYQQARNPSDASELIVLAKNLQLDIDKFTSDLSSGTTQAILDEEILFSRQLGVSSFPSLVLRQHEKTTLLESNYNNANLMLEQINVLLELQAPTL